MPRKSSGKYIARRGGQSQHQEGEEVGRVRPRKGIVVGTTRLGMPSMRSRIAGMTVNDTVEAVNSNFYSPELSTDFLELPQSRYEMWNYYRFFYRTNPFVGQAIDLHTELPLSKVRLGFPPNAKSHDLAVQAVRFCERWASRVKLHERLARITHQYHLIGEVFIFCEDDNPDVPENLLYDEVHILDEDGTPRTEKTPKKDRREAVAWMKRNYKGWTKVRILPPEQVHMEAFPCTDERLIEMIVDNKTKSIIEQADTGDRRAQRIVESMPPEIVAAAHEGVNVALNTDPDGGAFVHYLASKRDDYEEHGHSILERCLRTLVNWDKIRQAQASIASRHMTPIRLIWAENMDQTDIDGLRAEVDAALADPDYSIVTNFQVNWEEMGSDQRLMDLSNELDITTRELYAGLGVTESLLTGESSYSGSQISLEVINTRYMFLREVLQDFVEQSLFAPMCRRMGFIEEDDEGNEVVLVPKLSFTRLGVRDSSEVFEQMFNLYQKGSLDIGTLLEYLNLDPVAVRERLEADMFTPNDSIFNEALRGIYGESGRAIAENSDANEKIAKAMHLRYTKPKSGGERF